MPEIHIHACQSTVIVLFCSVDTENWAPTISTEAVPCCPGSSCQVACIQ